MWFQLQPAELDFVERAPHRFRAEAYVHAPAHRVFEIVAGEAMERWLPEFVALRWTSPEPFGEGTTRQLDLRLLSVKERVLAWEPGRRFAFTITAMTAPLLVQAVEDVHMEPIAARVTLLRWNVHYTTIAPLALAQPLMKRALALPWKKAVNEIAAYALERG
jgi:uncharacterized protein YndB with AHSA1/START domain